MTRKIEPINLLAEITRPGAPHGIKAGEMALTRRTKPGTNVTTDIILTWRMAQELALEAWAYKEFWLAANHLAKLMDSKQAGVYVQEAAFVLARDSYIDAKNKCLALQISKPNAAEIKVERENG